MLLESDLNVKQARNKGTLLNRSWILAPPLSVIRHITIIAITLVTLSYGAKVWLGCLTRKPLRPFFAPKVELSCSFRSDADVCTSMVQQTALEPTRWGFYGQLVENLCCGLREHKVWLKSMTIIVVTLLPPKEAAFVQPTSLVSISPIFYKQLFRTNVFAQLICAYNLGL